jgi:heme exporter protein A
MAASTCIDAVNSPAELAVQDLALVRGDRLVQQRLSFRVLAGETLAISGRNGAGKTSLLRAIAGFLELQFGSISLHLHGGRAVTSGEERGQYVGWIGHQDGIKPQLTPLEHLKFYRAYYRCGGDVADALTRTGLAQIRDLPAQYLSAGQRRRLAFARLILDSRPLWLFDEPLSALDADARNFVRTLIANHCSVGGIVVAATHEQLGVSSVELELI